MRYAQRLLNRIAAIRSPLCVGLDPRPDLLREPMDDFLRRVVDETAPYAAAFKPNLAYFEALGSKGLASLERLMEWRPKDVPFILDGKRGDIPEPTPPEEEVEVTGPITAKLYAATSARDTDWMVRLIDVQPDGFSAMLCEGVMRARHRDPAREGTFNPAKLSLIEPSQVYEYTIEFWRATANAFAKGHRIRVEISSSYFPLYLRNLNTGADNIGLEKTSVVATQKVMHTTEQASHIVLPVIPRKQP